LMGLGINFTASVPPDGSARTVERKLTNVVQNLAKMVTNQKSFFLVRNDMTDFIQVSNLSHPTQEGLALTAPTTLNVLASFPTPGNSASPNYNSAR